MSLDAIVQFIRNFLCTLKNLQIFRRTFLYDPTLLRQYYRFPKPLDQTTLLEFGISLSQLYAVVSAVQGGFTMMLQSAGKLETVQRLLLYSIQQRSQQRNNKKNNSPQEATDLDDLSWHWIQQSLHREGQMALRSIFVGFNVFCIGVSFTWLFANSWHITSTDWIGGLAGLIHALIVMEVCLLPLLWYMIKDASTQLQKSKHSLDLANRLVDSKSTITKDDITIHVLTELLRDEESGDPWTPFWDAGSTPSWWWLHGKTPSVGDVAMEDVKLQMERARVKALLQQLLVDSTSRKSSVSQVYKDYAEILTYSAKMAKAEGYREYVYLLINWIAFYGYFLGILAYYYGDDVYETTEQIKRRRGRKLVDLDPNADWHMVEQKQPTIVRYLKFGMENDLADWRGNFAGDVSNLSVIDVMFRRLH